MVTVTYESDVAALKALADACDARDDFYRAHVIGYNKDNLSIAIWDSVESENHYRVMEAKVESMRSELYKPVGWVQQELHR